MSHSQLSSNYINLGKRLVGYRGISACILERWYPTSREAPFFKIGGRVIYRVEDVIAM